MKPEHSDWLPLDIFHMDCFHRNSHKLLFFVQESWQTHNQQVWSDCHVMNYILTLLAGAVPGNTGPWSFFNRPHYTQSVLP